MVTLSTKIERLRSVGPRYLRRLHRVGIKTVQDLLLYFPHRYDDYSQIIPIEQLQIGETATIQGKILEINNMRTWRKRMNLTEAIIQDETGAVRAVWFNQPFLMQTLRRNAVVNLSGKVNFANDNLCLSNPTYEVVYGKQISHEIAASGSASPRPPRNDNYSFTHTGRLVPIYHETEGLSSRYLRYLIKPHLNLVDEIPDFLPSEIKKKFNLIDLNQAIRQIHFPENHQMAESARQRLSFDELFLIQMLILEQKQNLNKEKAPKIKFKQNLIKSFVQELPFKLTDDQRIAAWEIFQDLEKGMPMNRLLNGDVGSGKTIVAMMTTLQTANAGYQTALMAPTEILARQHYQTFKNFLKDTDLKIALLTSSDNIENAKQTAEIKSLPTRKQLKQKVSTGEIDIIIGTHALIADSKKENLSFKNLGLAIVDEQHRFGVSQRAALQRKIISASQQSETEKNQSIIPHLLSMTATPIPRTLSLTIYGDLDISLLKQMPKGRQKIITKLVPLAERKSAYNFIADQIKQRKQVFVVCPLIDESDKLTEIKSVTQEYEKLNKKIFPQFKIAMLHGKLKPKEKEEIMKNLKDKKTDILVSTSVIEVGIDIPNATVMMIEDADRFGLAQLHQFRGRIGRGADQSYCFLFTESTSKKTHQRLKALLLSQSGFELAEQDLKIRGPGDFLGTRQWGLPDLTMASLNDIDLIKQARQAATTVLSKNLITPCLDQKIKEFRKAIHLE